jgi:hypothetical protein
MTHSDQAGRAARRPNATGACLLSEADHENRFAHQISTLIGTATLRLLLERILALLMPQIEAASHDDAMIALALTPTCFVDPLSTHEVVVLACVLYMENLGRELRYGDVLALTHRFRGRAMNTTMVYNTLRDLEDRRLIDAREEKIDERTERLSRSFAINTAGRTAFRLAIMNAHHLDACKRPVAA